MAGRTFAGTTVRARFFPLQQYMSGNFSDKPVTTAATTAATTTNTAASSTPGFVILNADADGPQLPMHRHAAAVAATAADDDMGEMPDFDTMEYDAFIPTTSDAQTGDATAAGNGSDATAAAAGGAEEYDPFAAADEVD